MVSFAPDYGITSESLAVSCTSRRTGKIMDLQQPPDRMNQLVWTILAVAGAVLLVIGVGRYLIP